MSARRRRILLPGGRAYYKKVRASGPIAYWPLWESSGTVAHCLMDPAQDGTHSVSSLGNTGIGDGRTCPEYDGANDYTDIYSATLNGTFNGNEGTLMVWSQVSAAGIWTDGNYHFIAELRADTNNQISIRKSDTNNDLEFYRKAGAETDIAAYSASETGWICAIMTWSDSAELQIAYIDGAEVDRRVGIGTWVGALDSTECNIGASDNSAGLAWSGYLAHCAVWDRALSAAENANLSRV